MEYAPENTLASLREGVKRGADWVELDVQLTRDRRVVVLHDDTLDRTTTGVGSVEKHSFHSLQKLDAGSWFSPRFRGEKIPSLRRVLLWAKTCRTKRGALLGVVVEIKSHGADGARRAQRVARVIRSAGMGRRVVVISFDSAVIRGLRQASFPKGLLANQATPKEIKTAIALQARWVFPRHTALGPGFIRDAHRNGLWVGTWTVNSRFQARRLVEWGVNGMATNVPDKMVRL